ncbi:MAG: hypothetical protein K0R29_2713 [Pseudobdellovibrio sp.]|jgi:antitoxin component YwqK of YwqJK toxin-antitoxin module|nr:hypothetical protein [Pseudobdellovibrio sp.]
MRWLLLLILFSSCTKVIQRPSEDITYKGDRLLYKGQPFSGIVKEVFALAEVTRETEYKNGIKDGVQKEIYANGKTASVGTFKNENKDGTFEGWYPSGKRRFHYEYKNGQYHGESWEWYESGPVYLFAKFSEGKAIGKKVWREDGKIFLNHVFPGQNVFGLPGAKLCYQVRK